MGPLVQLLCSNGLLADGPAKGLEGLARKIQSAILWAPACTMKLFHQAYLPGIQSGAIKQFAMFTLKDAAEQDDNCARIYNKSLLYLVSNAFEEKAGLFSTEGEPLLGMEKFILKDKTFKTPSEKEIKKTNPPSVPLFGLPSATWIRSPNGLTEGETVNAAHSRRHPDFDDDKATVKIHAGKDSWQGFRPR